MRNPPPDWPPAHTQAQGVRVDPKIQAPVMGYVPLSMNSTATYLSSSIQSTERVLYIQYLGTTYGVLITSCALISSCRLPTTAGEWRCQVLYINNSVANRAQEHGLPITLVCPQDSKREICNRASTYSILLYLRWNGGAAYPLASPRHLRRYTPCLYRAMKRGAHARMTRLPTQRRLMAGYVGPIVVHVKRWIEHLRIVNSCLYSSLGG